MREKELKPPNDTSGYTERPISTFRFVALTSGTRLGIGKSINSVNTDKNPLPLLPHG
jgi:hypothetical protein